MNECSIVAECSFRKKCFDYVDIMYNDLFNIKYHWCRFEFAESRGYIHSHLMTISEDSTGAVHDELDDWCLLLCNLAQYPIHMLEGVPSAPTWQGAHDAMDEGMGCVFFCPDCTAYLWPPGSDAI